MTKRYTWLVSVYDAEGAVIDNWYIEGRTEQEAQSEAENQIPHVPGADDWTLMKISASLIQECRLCGDIRLTTEDICGRCAELDQETWG